MDRRHFLAYSGSGLVGLLPACGGGGGSGTTPTPTPTGIDWAPLNQKLSGTLLLPTQADFNTFAPVINTRYDAIKPQALVRCKNPDDVREVLNFAQQQQLPIAPRCGGHGYIGNSITSGIVIDVGLMSEIQVNNDGTAKIGAGAKLVDVYDTLIAQGVSIASGTCPTVGIAGITMGGGIGVLDRLYGLTCDNLIAAEMVTADGLLRRCDATNEVDLFWALRGGGGGNFGVATSFTFTTHPIRDFTVGQATFRFDDALAVFRAWQAWPAQIPDRIWGQLTIDFRGNVTLSAYALSDVADVTPYWSQLIDDTAVTPLSNDVMTRSYLDVMLAMCGNLTASQCHRVGQTSDASDRSRYAFVASSDFFNQALSDDAIQAFLQGIQNQRSSGASGYVILDLMQGAISRVANDATAFFHRDALFSVEYWVYTSAIGASWPTAMRTTMKPWSSGGAYVNYLDAQLQDWQSAYYGSNYTRLSQIKTTYDPKRVFNMVQGI